MKRLVRVAVLLSALLLLGIWLGTRGTPPDAIHPTAGAAAGNGWPTAVPTTARLDASLRALTEGEGTSPRDRWDPAWLAAKLGHDPARILAWVRGQTTWVPYHGSLRGARGVLLDRQGNSLDRALLLASLLQHSGHTVRLAHADLAAERAIAMLPELISRRRMSHGSPAAAAPADPAWRPVVRQVAQHYGLEADGVERSLAAGVDSTESALATLERRVEDQFHRLHKLLPAGATSDSPGRVDTAVSALRDHWWVQRLEGGHWIDLDLLGGAADSAVSDAASLTLDARSLPDSVYHRVSVRLVTEHWSRGALREQVAFESELRPSELAGDAVSLQVWPAEWPAEILPAGGDPRGAVVATALVQREWRAVLMVGDDPRADVVLDVSGGRRHAAVGGPMGGLGKSITGAVGGDQPRDDVFTAAWLEYETRVPGRAPRRERRVLFDLPGPAARAAGLAGPPELGEPDRVTRNLALMRQTEILLLGSVPDPAFVLHLSAQAAQANMRLLKTRLEDASGRSGEAFAEVADSIVAPPTPLYTLAMARFAWDAQGDVFLDRPNVLSRHIWLRPVAGGAVRAEANDIVLNEVGVAIDVADEGATRLRQGIRDTNGESLFPLGTVAHGSVGEAFAIPGDWIVVSSVADPSLSSLRISADVRVRMNDELNAGYVLVVPRFTSERGNGDPDGWWRIDPSTGNTLGMSRTGWGQTLLERAVKYAGIFSAAWAFEYLICRNGLYGLPGESGARTDGTVTFLLVERAHAQTSFCTINALIAGILGLGMEVATATWPLVLRTVFGRGYTGWLSGRPLFGSGGGGGTGAGSAPGGKPGAAPPPPECPPPSGPGAGARPNEPVPPNAGPRPGEPVPASEPPMQGAAPEPAPSEWYDPTMKWEPFDPAHVEQQRMLAREDANEAEQAFQEALAAYRKAATNAPKPLGEGNTPEETRLALEANTAEAELAQASAQRAAAREKQLVWERMGPVNDELIAAQNEMTEAQRQLRAQLNSGGGFDGPVYDRWSAATQRLTNAERAFNNASMGRPPSTGADGRFPPASQGQTQVIPKSATPGAPAESPTPASGSGAPGESAAPAECPGAGGPNTGKGPGTAPPVNKLDALRQQYQEANAQYEAANDAFYAYERQFEEAEKLAVQANQPTPERPPGYRDALMAKIDAMGRRNWARGKFIEAGGRVDSYGRPLDPAPGAGAMVGMAGGGSQ